MRIRHDQREPLRSGRWGALALVVLSACPLAPTNPYDPDTPQAQQAKGSLSGTVVLRNDFDSAARELELAALRVGLVDAGAQRLSEGGAPVALSLVDIDADDAGAARGRFVFDALVPGVYGVVVENVPSYYRALPSGVVTVLPGGNVDVGELLFELIDTEAGPGAIRGVVVAADGAAASHTVTLHQRTVSGVRVVESRASDADDGSFAFEQLAVGRYALVVEGDGSLPYFKLDLDVGEPTQASPDAKLEHDFSGDAQITLHAQSEAVVPTFGPDVLLDEGTVYVRGDAVPVAVLPFGAASVGVTGMRVAANAALVDGNGSALPFEPVQAAATVPLSSSTEGAVSIFLQLEARSVDGAGGFAFTSDTFSTTNIVRDVSAPTIVDAALAGLALDSDGTFLANAGNGLDVGVVVDAQDAVSAVDGLAIAVTNDDVEPDAAAVAALTFSDASAAAGLVRLNETRTLDGDGLHHLWLYTRDRARNVSAPAHIRVLLDRTAPDVPLSVVNAGVGGLAPRVLDGRTASLAFDEAAAGAAGIDLPVAMQLGLAPLVADDAALVPYAANAQLALLPGDAADGQVIVVEARLIDRAGNEIVVDTGNITLSLRARVAGVVDVEGVPEIAGTAGAAGVSARILRGAGGTVVASSSTDASGAFAFPSVPESAPGAVDVLELSAPGYRTTRVPLAAIPAQQQQAPAAPPLALETASLALARGTLTGAFRLQDVAGDGGAHAGIVVTLSLDSADGRAFSTSTLTAPDGTFTLRDLIVTLPGERFLIEARRDGYGVATAEGQVDVDGAVVVINPDANGAPTPALLPVQNAGAFDVCAGAGGACVVSQFISGGSARVRLRDTLDVVAIRVQARVAFLAGDAAPAFAPFDGVTNATFIDIGADDASDDGLVDIFVQLEKSDGTRSEVLTSTITKDTLAPAFDALVRVPASGAFDERFTRNDFVDVELDAFDGNGAAGVAFAPIADGRVQLVFVDAGAPLPSPPAAPPAGALLCADNDCRLALPGASTSSVAEGVHAIFAWACDAAGNCSAPRDDVVIVDKTPPSAAHGTGFTLLPDDVVVGGVTLLRSPLFEVALDVGSAADASGSAVVDENGVPVADVYAYRFSRVETTTNALVSALNPRPIAGDVRSSDVVVPALPASDGTFTIFAQLFDAAGNATSTAPNPFARVLRVDTAAPSVALRVEPGSFTTSRDVLLFVDVPPGGEVPTRMDVAVDDPTFSGAVANITFPLPPTGAPLTLPDVDSAHTVFARVLDDVGNFVERSDGITLDRRAPDIAFISCSDCVAGAGGQLFAPSASATIDVVASDAVSSVATVEVTVVSATDIEIVSEPFDGDVVIPLVPGEDHDVEVRVFDGAGNVTPGPAVRSLVISADDGAPAVPVVDIVAANASVTSERLVEVRVTVGAGDDDIVGMRVATFAPPTATPTFTGALGALSDSAFVTLPGLDGNKQVCVQVQDVVGQVAHGCDTIALDETSPAGSVSVAAGAATTRNLTVTAALSYDVGTTGIAVSSSSLDCGAATYTTVSATSTSASANVTLPVGDGSKTVFACFKDDAGNSSAASDDIVLDTSAPVASAALAGNASFTSTTSVQLSLSSADAARMNIAEGARTLADCNAGGVVYIPFASSSTVTLSAAQGAKTVSVCLEDAAGNRAVVSDDITLDSVPSSVTVSINAGAAATRLLDVTLTSTTSELVDIAVSTASLVCATATYEAFTSTRAVRLAGPDGTNTVFACFRDRAGNFSQAQDSITLDRASPGGSVAVNGGAAITSQRDVIANLTFDGDTVQLAVSATTSNCDGLTFTTPSATVPVTLLAGRGDKTVFACFRDAAGNTTLAQDSIFLDEADSAGLSIAINGDAATTTSRNILVSLTAPPDVTQMKVVEGATIDCTNPTGYESFASPKALTLAAAPPPPPLFEGTRVVSACVKNAVGQITGPSQDSIFVDTFVPAGSVAINAGASSTNALNVTLSLSADADVHNVSLSTDSGISCATATYEAFTSTKSFALAGPDGNNSVFACLKDDGGNTRLVNDSITLDRAAPSPVSVSVPDFSSSTTVSATLSFPSDAVEVAAAEGALACDTASYVAATTSLNVPISAGDGSKAIVVCFRDAAGNSSQAVDSTTLDTQDPSGSVVIAGGANFTTSTSVQLSLTAPGDVDRMSIAEGATQNCATATYVPFVQQPAFTLSTGDATKNVAVCFKDRANRTALAVDSIVLDETRPTGTITINSGDQFTNSRSVVLSIAPSAGVTDVAEIAFADGATLACGSASFVALAPSLPHVLPSGDGTKQVALCLKDRAGNLSTVSVNDSITLDQTAPSSANASLTIAAGAAFTTSTTVGLSLTFPADVLEMAIANDGLDCSSATYTAASTTVASHGLLAGDGNKTVVACLRDRARNTFLATDTIALDTAPPSSADTSISINAAAPFATSTTLTLTFTAPNDVAQIALGEGAAPSCATATYATLTSPLAFPLTNTTDGTKTIFACFRENAGRTLLASDSIVLDQTRPTLTSVQLNGAASGGATNNRNVAVAVNGASADTVSMALAEAATLDCTSGAAVYVPFASASSRLLSSGDGAKTVSVCLKDAAGNVSSASTAATITLDTVGPGSVAVSLNSGATVTNGTSATAALSFSAVQPATRFAVAEGALDCASAATTAFTSNPQNAALTLSSGDGTKTVVACFRDDAGNIATAQDSIVVDTTAPAGTVTLAGGAQFTRTQTTAAQLTASDDVTLIAVQVAGAAPNCATQTYSTSFASSINVDLGATEGSRTVFVCFRDSAGNTSSAAASDAITKDTVAPTVSAFTINGSTTPVTNSVNVTVAVSASSDVVEMALLSNGTLDCGTTQAYGPFVSPIAHTLVGGVGSQNVSLCVRDAAGNPSNAGASTNNRTVTLDTTAPAGSVSIASGAAFATSATVGVTVSTTPAESGLQFALANTTLDCLTASYAALSSNPLTIASHALDAAGGDGGKLVVACFRDPAGNVSSASDGIVLDTHDPVGTLTINDPEGDGDGFANTRNITVALTIEGESAATSLMHVYEGAPQACTGFAAGVFEAFSTSKSLTLSAGDERKTVSACFKDAAGRLTPLAVVPNDSILLDQTAPTGALDVLEGTVFGGTHFVNTTDVTLDVQTQDEDVVAVAAAEGTLDCDSAGTSYEPFSSTIAFATSAGEGAKSLVACLLTASGQTVLLSKTVTLDTTAPAGTLALNGGAAYTSSTTVSVRAQSAETTGLGIRFAGDGLDCASAGGYAAFDGDETVDVTLSATEGTRTAAACLKDPAGNATLVLGSINVDLTNPEGIAASCASCLVHPVTGASFTNVTSVTLEVDAIDPNPNGFVDLVRTQVNTGATVDQAFDNFVQVTLPATQAAHAVHVFFVDAAGRVSAELDTDPVTAGVQPLTITLDTTAPDANLVLAGTPSSTNTRLQNISASLSGASIDTVSIELSELATFADAVTQDFTLGASYPFVLSAGDASKTVRVRLTDAAGNVNSNAITANIRLDTTAPTTPRFASTVTITSGATASVTALLTASTDTGGSGLRSPPYNLTIPAVVQGSATCPAGTSTGTGGVCNWDGTTTINAPLLTGDNLIRVRGVDLAANQGEDDVLLVERDTTAPASPTIRIVDNNFPSADGFTPTTALTLQLSASDANGIATMRVAEDGVPDTEAVVAFSSAHVLVLTGSDGPRTIGVQFFDPAGNVSATATDTTTLDREAPSSPRIETAPTVIAVDPGGSRNFFVRLLSESTDDNGVQYQVLGGDFLDWTDTDDEDPGVTVGFNFNLVVPTTPPPPNELPFNLGVRAIDGAGNISGEDFVTIIVDTTAPSAPAGLAAEARSSEMSVTWTPNAATENVKGYRVLYAGFVANPSAPTTDELDGAFATQGRSPIDIGNVCPPPAPICSFTLSGLSDNSNVVITVQAYDAAQRFSPLPAVVETVPNEVVPQELYRLSFPQPVVGFDVQNDTAYVSCDNGTGTDPRFCVVQGLTTLGTPTTTCISVPDLASPANDTRSGKVKVFGNFAYVVNPAKTGIRVFNVTNPAAPADNVITPAVAPRPYHDLVFTGRYVFGTPNDGSAAVDALRFSNTPGSGALTFVVQSASVGSGIVGIDAQPTKIVVSISNGVRELTFDPTLAAPTFALGRFINTGGLITAGQVSLMGDKVYIGALPGGPVANGLVVGDLATGTLTTEVVRTAGCNAFELIPGYAICDDRRPGAANSLFILSTVGVRDNDANWDVRGRLRVTAGNVTGVRMLENSVVASMSTGELALIELARPVRFDTLGAYTEFNDLKDVVLRGNVAYVRGAVFLFAVDLSDPDDPDRIGAQSFVSQLGSLHFSGSSLVSISPTGTTWAVVDSNPLNMQTLSTGTRPAPDGAVQSRGAQVHGHVAYIENANGFLESWVVGSGNTTNTPTTRTGTVNVTAPGHRDPAIDHGALFHAGADGVVRRVNITNPAAMAVTASQAGFVVDTTGFSGMIIRQPQLYVTSTGPNPGATGVQATNISAGSFTAPAATAFPCGYPVGAGDSWLAADGVTAGSPPTPGLLSGVRVQQSAAPVRNIGVTLAIAAPNRIRLIGPMIISANGPGGGFGEGVRLMRVSR